MLLRRLFAWALPLLIVLLAVLLGYWATQQHWQRDLSLNKRNSLSPQSAALLHSMPGPIEITAYATAAQDAKLGDLRLLISEFLRPWQQAKPDIRLNFIDPAKDVAKARAAGVQVNGELVVRYGARSQSLRQLSEEALANTLQRLARSGERVVLYLDTHGEPDLAGRANFDLGEFGQNLAARGFRLEPLDLGLAPAVPANADLLVLTRPRVPLLPGEVARLLDYVERGGNLVWLVDPGPLNGLEPLAERLSLQVLPGTIIDPAATGLRAPETWAISGGYGRHPIFNDFRLLTAFPDARALEAREQSRWQMSPLISVAANGWLETGDTAKPEFAAGRDIAGPLTVAMALERRVGEHAQRAVVVGNSSFLANMYLGNAGNLDLGINIFNWVAGDDKLITVQPKVTRDAQLLLSPAQAGVMASALLFGVPGILLLAGGIIWWRRRA